MFLVHHYYQVIFLPKKYIDQIVTHAIRTCSLVDFVWSCPHLHTHFSFFSSDSNINHAVRSQFLHFHLSVTNQDLQCWRVWMKLSTSPCSRSIASIMLPRSGQSKQVLILFLFLFFLFLLCYIPFFSQLTLNLPQRGVNSVLNLLHCLFHM